MIFVFDFVFDLTFPFLLKYLRIIWVGSILSLISVTEESNLISGRNKRKAMENTYLWIDNGLRL